MGNGSRKAARRGDMTLGRWIIILTASALAAAIPLHAVAQDGAPTGVLVPNAVEVVLDRAAPTAGKLVIPPRANELPVTLTYSGAGDGEGSGLKAITLWMKQGAQGAWAATGTTATAASGSFAFDGATGDGTLYFALQAEDNAGNRSTQPQGEGDGGLLLDRTAPVITILGSASVVLEAGAAYSDAGATAKDAVDGDLTSKISVDNGVDTSTPGTYYVHYSVTDSAGNASAPVYRTVTVSDRYTLTLVQPATGTIEANPAPTSNGKYAVGSVVSLRYVSSGLGTHGVKAWSGATPDALSPDLASVTMSQDRTVSVTLERYTGTVVVDVTPNTAGWTVTDGDGKTRPGTGDSVLTGVPTGSVAIEYAAVQGMVAPTPQRALLNRGAQVPFRGSYTQSAVGTISLSPDLRGAPGDLVECPVQASNATGLQSYGVRTTFDRTLAEVVDVAPGGLTSGWAAPTLTKGTGEFVVSASGPACTASGGVLCTVRLRVRFTAALGAKTDLTLVSPVLNGGAMNAAAVNGALTVASDAFVWGDVNGDGKSGDSDAALILQRRAGLVTQFSTPAAESAANVTGESPAVVGAMDAAWVLKRAAGATIAFPADLNGDSKGPDTGTPAVGAVPASRKLGFATSIEAAAGATVAVPVTLEDGSDVHAYLIDLTYDPALVEFLGAARGSLGPAWTVPVVNAQPGRLIAVGAGAQAAAGSGSLVAFNFRAKQALTAQMPVFTLDRTELNDGAIPVADAPTGSAPLLEGLSPARGAEDGGTVVTLRGANLGNVTEVRFGTTAAAWTLFDEAKSTLTTASPAGTGVVNVEVVAPAGTARLDNAFTYFSPVVFLTLTPPSTVAAGHDIDVPIWLTADQGAAGVTFRLRFDKTLFAVRQGGEPLATAGDAATKAGKTVAVRLTAPGEIEVTVSGGAGKTMASGLLCTSHLIALGDTTDATGLIYITGTTASGGNAKALPSAEGFAR